MGRKNPSSKFIINEQPITISSKVIYDELDRAITTIDEEGNTATVQFAIAEDVNGINCLKTTSDMDQNGAQHVISETYHDASGKLLSTKMWVELQVVYGRSSITTLLVSC